MESPDGRDRAAETRGAAHGGQELPAELPPGWPYAPLRPEASGQSTPSAFETSPEGNQEMPASPEPRKIMPPSGRQRSPLPVYGGIALTVLFIVVVTVTVVLHRGGPAGNSTAVQTSEALATTAPSARSDLLQHVPRSVQAKARCDDATDMPTGAVTEVDCALGAGEVPSTAEYIRYRDGDALASDTAAKAKYVRRETHCKTYVDFADDGGSHATLFVDGIPSGDIWCYTNHAHDPVLLWHRNGTDIAGVAIAPNATSDEDIATLLSWFSDAGPV